MNSKAIIAVVGCYSQIAPNEVENIDGVNIVLGTSKRTKIVDIVKKFQEDNKNVNFVGDIMHNNIFEDMQIHAYKERTRAFLKIQEGCNQFCSYCIIPYSRGPIRSKNEENVINEVSELAGKGFKEVVLTGIHLTSYGLDLKNTNLLQVIKKIHNIEKLNRIRLGSLEPMYIDGDFVKETRELHKLCPHYHLSLQSGCDDTLRRMNRNYLTKEYKDIVDCLRINIPNVSITTDIMVGFPGETDEEFEKTYKFVEEIAFSKIHIFKYSKRKGTKAADFINQISPEVKEERSKKLTELADNLEYSFFQQYIGQDVEVLFEKNFDKENKLYEGLTSNYISVLVESDNDLCNSIKKIRLTEIKQGHIVGEII